MSASACRWLEPVSRRDGLPLNSWYCELALLGVMRRKTTERHWRSGNGRDIVAPNAELMPTREGH